MRAKLLGSCLLLTISWTTGCAHMTPTERGAGVGGLIGAGTGALVGNAVGKTGAGALIGAGVGALSGGLIGNSVEQAEHRAEVRATAAAAGAPQRGPLGMMDVVSMSQAGVSDPVIISQIRTTGSAFNLSSNDTIFLKQQGVTDAVLTEMLATANRYPRRPVAVYPAPVYPAPVYQPVYVVPPPPPPVIGVGFGYSRRR